MGVTEQECVDLSPAHLHANIFEDYQREGWGEAG